MDTLRTFLTILIVTLLFGACSAGKKAKSASSKAKEKVESAAPKEQVFTKELDDKNEEGKCYTKVQTAKGKQFLEVLCPHQLTPELKHQVKTKLYGLGYTFSEEEFRSDELGAETLAALVDFQNKSGLHSGVLDPATMDALGISNY